MLMIRVENLSKVYRYRTPGFVARTIREQITGGAGRVLGRGKETENRKFHALKEINFTVRKGESVGIVGANGSGKSTLLKILARIAFPSSGEAFIYGRLGALLEVGGGFNQDLTGRENIYLLGSMMGMSIGEIRSKFARIVAFAELDKFLETQVKHYSSGMQVRLAFSIGIHYQPDILLLDEILAVGDVEFQSRCLEKISELQNRGITALFVSHDLEKMRQVCRRAIWLENGIQKMDDAVATVERAYLQSLNLEKSPNPIR